MRERAPLGFGQREELARARHDRGIELRRHAVPDEIAEPRAHDRRRASRATSSRPARCRGAAMNGARSSSGNAFGIRRFSASARCDLRPRRAAAAFLYCGDQGQGRHYVCCAHLVSRCRRVLVAGCSGMSEQACVTADWRTVGFEDGTLGRSEGEHRPLPPAVRRARRRARSRELPRRSRRRRAGVLPREQRLRRRPQRRNALRHALSLPFVPIPHYQRRRKRLRVRSPGPTLTRKPKTSHAKSPKRRSICAACDMPAINCCRTHCPILTYDNWRGRQRWSPG